MKVSIHLHFSGECRQAFKFYESILGGTSTLLTYGESPAAVHVPTNWHEKIIHASLTVNGMEIAGADTLPEKFKPPQGFQLILQIENEEEAKDLFSKLAQNGTVTLPIGETFWSPCYGMVTDQFNIAWEVNCSS